MIDLWSDALSPPLSAPQTGNVFNPREGHIFPNTHRLSGHIARCHTQVSPPPKVAEHQSLTLLWQLRWGTFFSVSGGKASNVVRRAEPLISDYCQAEGQREETLPSVSPSLSKHSHIHKRSTDTHAHTHSQHHAKILTSTSRPSQPIRSKCWKQKLIQWNERIKFCAGSFSISIMDTAHGGPQQENNDKWCRRH